MKKIEVTIGAINDGMRLDLALVAADTGLSRRKIRAIIDVGGCYVNRKRIRVASRAVAKGDRVQLEYSDTGLSQAKKSTFVLTDADILFEDDQIVAINKPPGLPTQAMRTQAIMHVETCLKQYYKSKSLPIPPLSLVHRLDKDTSGVLLVAKNKKSAENLMAAFRDRHVRKTYLAIARNIPPNNRFRVECKLSPIDQRTGMVREDPRGKSSLTDFKVVAADREANLALIACFPVTGRSHQLRVHLANVNSPILGDKRYGGEVLGRAVPTPLLEMAADHHFLHALALQIPGYDRNQDLEICAPLPLRMSQACESLGWGGDILRPTHPKLSTDSVTNST